MSRLTDKPSARPRSRAGVAVALIALAVSMVPAIAMTSADAAPGPAPSAPADSLWTATSERIQASSDGHRRRVNPRAYRAYTLDHTALRALLATAPDEVAVGATPATLRIPAPNGELVAFEIVESPVAEDAMLAKYPDIRAYAGHTTNGSPATIRLDVGPQGFHASVRGAGAAWYIDPAYNGDDRLYVSYLGSALPEPEQGLVEPELDQQMADDIAESPSPGIGEGPNGVARQRDYRLAFLTDPSYATYFAPGANDTDSNTAVFAEKVTLVNRMNQIYGDDVGVRMLLIAGTDTLNFNNAAETTGTNGPCGPTACFTASQVSTCSSATLTRNRLVVGQLIGAANFDIGHIGFGLNGGGIASLGVVGGNSKAQGCTGVPTPTGDLYAVDYVAHEIGHQFDGNHTFNSSVCEGNRNPGTSVEPGSGSSVMAYAGICGADDLQPHSDPYFSQRSQTEMGDYINSTLTNVSEVVSSALTGFDGTDSFTLTFGAVTTGAITNGTNYNAAGIKLAIESAFTTAGTPGVVATVGGYFGGSFGVNGFQVSFGGTLAGADVANMVVNPTGFTAQTGEIAKGGPPTNGGSTVTMPGNHNPTVTAPADKSIPLRTPFALTGSATDSDADTLIYLWEQNDIGGASGTALQDDTKLNGPLFRVFGKYADVSAAGTLMYNSPGENLAGASPTRVFPDMDQVLADTTNAETGSCAALSGLPLVECYAEFLPTLTYVGDATAGNVEPSLNFRLTARDTGGPNGGTHFDDVKLTIDKTAGPFQVTSQAAAATYTAGSTQTVTWAVNNTQTLAPNVKISFSGDGGQTFPSVLAASTPNNGTANVVIPAAATTTGRIKIEAVGNYFFDVNDAPVTITATGDPTPPQTTITSGPANGSYLLATAARFGYASSEAGGTFACKLNGAIRACAAPAVTLTGLTQRTHKFTVAATDQASNPDLSPATRTFTVPVDDRRLAIKSGPWKRKSARSSYLGTYTKVKKKGAELTFKVTGARSLALVVSRAPGYGKVKVFLGSTKLKTVSLKGAKASRVVIPVASLGSGQSGTVRIVTTSNKQVRIDGLGVVTALP